MALIIPPGFLHAVYELSVSGDPEPMVVTMGHAIDGASGATGEEAPDDLFNAFANNIMPNLPSVVTLERVTCYIGNDGGNLIEDSTEAPVAGGASSSGLLPPNSAYLVRKRTDLAGRRGRGRLYLPMVPEGEVDNLGNVSSVSVTAWNLVLAGWFDDLTAAIGARLYPPVVLHRSEGIGVEPAPTPVAALLLDPKIATQRRRLRP